jgi:hypothetical protein
MSPGKVEEGKVERHGPENVRVEWSEAKDGVYWSENG